uniref:MULE transposase domain-containing protein n=1 Tax=Ditylenchus dipsaci TaxID=166011 RepID=A0A915D5P8_9BILA
MNIPLELRKYKDSSFVIFDSGPSNRRIIIFSTLALTEFLQNSEWWGFDGTFDLVPKKWKQLLTLHAKQGESFVPCLHALLPKKSRRTYDRFFAAVQQLIPEARVRHAHMDFERTLIGSFEHHYNLAEKHGCFAHFSRALNRRVQKLGLRPCPSSLRRLRVVMLRCTHNADRTPIFEEGLSQISCLLQLIFRHRLDFLVCARPMFPNELWNCFELTKAGNSKMTDSLEAWHNALKLVLGSSDGKKPKFWKWLRHMKKECSLKEAELVRL